MAACKDHCLVPGLRVCKGRQVCPLHSSSPAECDLLFSLPLSLSFLHLDQAPAPNAFQQLSLYHTDTLSYQEYKHTDSLTHKFSAFNPSHAVQTNQQLEPEACCPSGRPFPAGPSVQIKKKKRERKPSNPHPDLEVEGLIVSPSQSQGWQIHLCPQTL